MRLLYPFFGFKFSFFKGWIYLVTTMVGKVLSLLILLVLSAFFHPAVAQVIARDSGSVDTTGTKQLVLKVGATKSDSLIQYAYTFLGDRYKRGGISTAGFDCSGYTMTVFKRFGIKLPHTSAGQGLVGVPVSKQNIQKGDLILFKGRSRKSNRIGHVGIVISEKGEPVRFIHSSTSEGVRIDRGDYDYYKKRFVKAVRLPELYK
jgi:murein DD-endopeptidase / murein LD-carboxypeptidase